MRSLFVILAGMTVVFTSPTLVGFSSSAFAATPRVCDELLAKVFNQETWKRFSPELVGRDLNGIGETVIDIGLTIDIQQLQEIFKSHPLFNDLGRMSVKEVAYSRKWDGGIDLEYSQRLKNGPEFPSIYRDLGIALGRKLEGLLIAALPAESLELERVILRWYNARLADGRADVADDAEVFDDYRPRADAENVHLKSVLVVHGDGTLSWGPDLEGSTASLSLARKTRSGAFRVMSGRGRENFLNQQVIATKHSAPHTHRKTERLMYLFYFKPKTVLRNGDGN